MISFVIQTYLSLRPIYLFRTQPKVMILTLDLKDFTEGSPETQKKFVSDLGEAYEKIGFIAIKNHGLTDEFITELYAAVKSFFDYRRQSNKNMSVKT